MQTLNKMLDLIPSILAPTLVDLGIKSFALLALAAMAAFMSRSASAATRHLVWFTSFVGLLLLPVLSIVLPSWQVLPQWADAKAQAVSRAARHTTVIDQPDAFSTPVRPPLPANTDVESLGNVSSSVVVDSPPADAKRFNVISLGPAMWLVALLISLTVPMLGAVSLWRLGRVSSQITDGKWLQLLGGLLRMVGIRRRITLLQSRYRRMPMTWGMLRPKLLLPQEAEKWTEQRRRVVLLHELAHVKRHDCFTNLVAQIACALYWFNPLVWVAARRMAIERERACDDIVLINGARPADYAEQILRIASDLPPDRWGDCGAIAIARRSNLESRLLAILDVHRNRKGITRLTVTLSILLLAAAVCPLAIMRAADEKPSATSRDSVAFGPIIERRIYDPDMRKDDVLLDLDSGKLFSEASFGAKDSESRLAVIDGLLKLVRNEKIDLMGDASGHSLAGLDLLVIQVPNEQFDAITPQGLARDQRLDGWTQTEAELTPKELPATYVFKTRETGRGVLQIIRFNKHESADIRYKMVRAQFNAVAETILPLGKTKRFLTLDDREFHDLFPTNKPVVHLEHDSTLGLSLVFNEIYNVREERERGIRVWNSMSAQQVVDAYREAGFALLPQERNGIYPIRKDHLPLTVFLPTMGFLQVTEVLEGSTPSVKVRYKLILGENKDESARSAATQRSKAAEFSSLPEKPWTATGRVTDAEGKPLADVEIWVHAGIGSLHRVATAITDADGHYSVSFGRGVLMSTDDPNLQIVNVTAHKLGWFEKNLNRHGARAGALRAVPAEELESFHVPPENMFLLGKTQTIDFAMAPAARIKGRLLGTGRFSNLSPQEARKHPKAILGTRELRRSPLTGWRVWLAGKELPPACSVLATATTDNDGNFTFESVPIGFEWQFQTETHHSQPEPKSPTFKLDSAASPFAFEILLELPEQQDALRFLSNLPRSERRVEGESPAPQQANEYEVRSGDTLASIVATLRQRGTELSRRQLMEANSSVNWQRLRVGQKIVIPEPAPKRIDPSRTAGDSGIRVFNLTNTDAKSVARALQELAPTARVEIDERTNAVIVNGSKEVVAAAAEIVHRFDVPEP